MFQAKSLKEILQPKTLFDKTYIRFQASFTFCNLNLWEPLRIGF
jgi:hypothetical protein